ncbi:MULTISPECIES: hypothetical protein [Cellulomonadaceae]|jgi:ZIP family zinc transporter|uniref:hypothetical protein n=1 Tax=Cellulomonadaceae TaxID=85016 RepID=UPI0016655180|nr:MULTISPECIES: hypothetical protein [Cellulomonadaceae]MDT0166484.1 hypothetical protein [Actinotalea sp. AC32]GGC14302.1 hypothetical protein GCM10010972_29520 [Cellulomonas carbonis]
MTSYWLVLGLAALPALGNFAGGALAEFFRVSDRTLSLALHLAAGIVLAVVGLELMPEALAGSPAWVPMLAFVAGGAAFIGLDRVAVFVQARLGRPDEDATGSRTRAVGIFSGVSMDLFSDGVMIGTGAVINRPDSPRLTTGAEVELVEFLDFECEACGAIYAVVEDLKERYGASRWSSATCRCTPAR